MSLFWSIHCRDCFNCKQKTIKTADDLEEFTDRKRNEIRKGWREKIIKNGVIDFYWCGLERNVHLRTVSPSSLGSREKGKFCSFIDN